jgi:hypothetical protein
MKYFIVIDQKANFKSTHLNLSIKASCGVWGI